MNNYLKRNARSSRAMHRLFVSKDADEETPQVSNNVWVEVVERKRITVTPTSTEGTSYSIDLEHPPVMIFNHSRTWRIIYIS